MTCAKVRVKCTLVLENGQRIVGYNDCLNPQLVCPRSPDEGYDKCQTICHQPAHAEVAALKIAGQHAKGATAYVEHKRVCDSCAQALQDAGVKRVVLGPPPVRVNRITPSSLRNPLVSPPFGMPMVDPEYALLPPEKFLEPPKASEDFARIMEGLNDALDIATGVKFDQDKPRYDLIPPEFMDQLATLYARGAKKYADRNWEKGMKPTRIFGALMRHAWAWMRGETHDPETGAHHMVAVAWNAIAIVTYHERGMEDDRPSIQKAA